MSTKVDQAIRDVVKGASIVYFGLILEVVIAFLAQVLAARYLTLTDFGGLTTGIAILDIGAVVATLGLGEGLTRYLPREDEEDKRSIAWLAFFVPLVLSIAIGAALVFNAGFIASQVFGDPAVETSIQIFGAAIPFASLLLVAVGGIRGQKRPVYRIYVENLTRPLVRFGLVILAVLYGLGQAGFAGAYTVPYVASSILAVYLFTRTLPEVISWPRIDWRLAGRVLRYSVPFVATGMASFIYRSIDIFMVLYFLDSSSVGTYGVAYAAGRLMLTFSSAMNFLGAPIASELDIGTKSKSWHVHNSMVRWLLIVSVPAAIPLVFFPEEFITFLYRPRYASGSAALAVLAIGFLIHNVSSAHGNVLRALGNSRELAINNVFAAVLNVVLNLVLIPRYGILGAAIATVSSYLLIDAMMTVELYYHTGQNPFSDTVMYPGLIAIPLLLVARIAAPRLPSTFPWIVVFTVAFALVYLASIVVILGLTSQEVMIIRSALERYGIDLGPMNDLIDRFAREP